MSKNEFSQCAIDMLSFCDNKYCQHYNQCCNGKHYNDCETARHNKTIGIPIEHIANINQPGVKPATPRENVEIIHVNSELVQQYTDIKNEDGFLIKISHENIPQGNSAIFQNFGGTKTPFIVPKNQAFKFTAKYSVHAVDANGDMYKNKMTVQFKLIGGFLKGGDKFEYFTAGSYGTLTINPIIGVTQPKIPLVETMNGAANAEDRMFTGIQVSLLSNMNVGIKEMYVFVYDMNYELV